MAKKKKKAENQIIIIYVLKIHSHNNFDDKNQILDWFDYVNLRSI